MREREWERFDPNPLPQVSPQFSRHVNLRYLASDDPYKMHRALFLKDIGTELSGRYSCRVSSIHGEDYRSTQMIIYGEHKGHDL